MRVVDEHAGLDGVECLGDRREACWIASRHARDELEVCGRVDGLGDGTACPAGDAGDAHADHAASLTTQSMSDTRSQRERMLAGDLYIAGDPELARESRRAAELVRAYNLSPRDRAARSSILAELLGSFGVVALDVARITIGDDVQIGPRVQLLTPTHPVDAELRRAKWEAAEPIAIGDNVWLGGGVIVCPGVTIGDDTVVGAGAVVTRDLPAGVLAVGSPARIIRDLEAAQPTPVGAPATAPSVGPQGLTP